VERDKAEPKVTTRVSQADPLTTPAVPTKWDPTDKVVGTGLTETEATRVVSPETLELPAEAPETAGERPTAPAAPTETVPPTTQDTGVKGPEVQAAKATVVLMPVAHRTVPPPTVGVATTQDGRVAGRREVPKEVRAVAHRVARRPVIRETEGQKAVSPGGVAQVTEQVAPTVVQQVLPQVIHPTEEERTATVGLRKVAPPQAQAVPTERGAMVVMVAVTEATGPVAEERATQERAEGEDPRVTQAEAAVRVDPDSQDGTQGGQ